MTEAQHSILGNIAYTGLTTMIIVLGKLRDKTCKTRATACLRFDRTIAWNKELSGNHVLMGCCDCGLSHYLVPGHSVTPVRTGRYGYKLRFGANAWAEPDESLIETVNELAKHDGVI